MLKPMVHVPHSDARIEQMRQRAQTVRAEGALTTRVHSALIHAEANAAEDTDRINRILQERLSIFAAALLPASAFLLYLLFPGRFYAEHVVHALHLHAFTFVVLSTYLAVSYSVRMIDMSALTSVAIPTAVLTALCAIFGYSLVSLRRTYQASLMSVLWKGAVLSILYLIVFTGIVVVYISGVLLLM